MKRYWYSGSKIPHVVYPFDKEGKIDVTDEVRAHSFDKSEECVLGLGTLRIDESHPKEV